jgi:hypothetical protein
MRNVSCPRCGFRIGTRGGITPLRCPRCLARRGAKVELVEALLAERMRPDQTQRPLERG